MADIFREVDEELRREGLLKLWRRYGRIVVGAALAIIAAVVGYRVWSYYVEQRQIERAQAYASAVAAVGAEDEAAIQALQELASGEDGYAALAHLQAAALKAEAGQTEEAIAIYRNLAANAGIDRTFRDLATVLMVAHGLDTASPDEAASQLEPLTDPGNPWRFSAKELLAVLAIRTGDSARATQLYQELADSLEAPPNLRARATEMLAALQG